MNRMNLELIRSFAALGEERHYGVAARRLGISQPSLTKQIRRLEDLLGAPLFLRSRQGTELTTFGRAFLEDVRPFLRQAETIWERGLLSAVGERGRLAVGFSFSSIPAMARILQIFQMKCPDVSLLFEDVASERQLEKIRDGNLDVGFVRHTVGLDLAHRIVATDRLVFLFPNAWRDRIDDIGSPQVKHLPFIALRPESSPGLERHMQALFVERDIEPERIHRVRAALTVIAMVAEGLGVALLHESALLPLGLMTEHITARPIDDVCARWEVAMVWRQHEQGPTLKRFLQEAEFVLAQKNAVGGGKSSKW